MKKNSDWLVCFGYPWSDKRIYGGGNITLQFYNEGKRVLWVNPIPNRSLSISGATSKKSALRKRIIDKLIQQIKIFKFRSKNFYILSPFYFPLVENKTVYRINQILIYIQVRFTCLLLGVKKPLVCTMGTNDNVNLINSLNYTCWFHNAGDLYHDLRGASPETKDFLYKLESKIFNSCDVIFVASWVMVEKVKKMVKSTNKVKYFPHGSDVNHFTKNLSINNEISAIKKPVIGYFGSLTNANDQDILLAIANHGYNLILIGDILGDYSACLQHPNIYFIKAVPYETLPSYAQYFDVGILAWKPAQWITNCNPKKTYEYLALGLPIVSVPIPQLEYELKGYIAFASTPNEFVDQIKIELKSDSSEKRKARIQRAQQESWENKFSILKQALSPYVR